MGAVFLKSTYEGAKIIIERNEGRMDGGGRRVHDFAEHFGMKFSLFLCEKRAKNREITVTMTAGGRFSRCRKRPLK